MLRTLVGMTMAINPSKIPEDADSIIFAHHALRHPLNNGPFSPRASRKGDTNGDPNVPHFVHGGRCNALADTTLMGLFFTYKKASEIAQLANAEQSKSKT
jgi:hypothetical protein